MLTQHNPLPAEKIATLCELFSLRATTTPTAPAYRDFTPAHGWHHYNWMEIADDVAQWQAALLAEGLSAGDRVAIMLRNCTDWVRFDQAALGLGLVVVPLYMQDRPENSAYILNDSGARLLLLESDQQWQKIVATGHLKESEEGIQRVLVQNDDPVAKSTTVISLSAWLNHAPSSLLSRVKDPNTLATIVYTSGTTGQPKGVMLSHRNIVSNLTAVDQSTQLFTDDLLLSFLPLSHMLERTAGYYLPIFTGSEVAFTRSVAELSEDLRQVRPTVLISVPRIFERAENAVHAKLATKPTILQRLFGYTVDLGWRNFEHQQRGATKPLNSWLLPLLLRLFARPVLRALGGRLRFAVCGGAPLA
ncbi:MAG: long-chain fatty acid--CoA ligase, partial [Gammaproteobacteria bacterium]